MSLTSFCAAESFQALALFDRLARPARTLLSLRPLIVRATRRKRLMKYPFVPISERKPLRWPNGKRLAVMITTNLEYWDATKDTSKPFYPGGPGIVGGDLPGDVYDNPNWTWREYGQRVGVWRMFDIFDQFGVPSTCTMNARWDWSGVP